LLLALLPYQAFAITLAQLQTNIQGIINRTNTTIQWSILIENDNGSTVYYSLNPDVPRRPASNTKIFVTSGAMGINGPTYVWRGYQLQDPSTANAMESTLSSSNNTYADELYTLVPGTGNAIINYWASQGIDMTGAVMLDGSGLNYDNRFTSRQTLKVVRHMMTQYSYSQWATHLAISCTKGTIASRLCGTGFTGAVHAKTGTLTNGGTLALSGYVDNTYDGQRYYFSIYANNVSSKARPQSDALLQIDDIVKQMCQAGLPNNLPTPIVVDNTTSGGFSASTNWFATTSSPGYLGTNYLARAVQPVSDLATWTATVPATGSYRVYARWTTDPNRSTAAPYTVLHSGGSSTVFMNQQLNNGSWMLLGSYNFTAGTAPRVQLSCWAGSGQYVVADAIRLEPQ
ncbi:MAG: D-alanyl-D-alanine carboxypeptidase, partial [Candidatus Sumerlaeia bacterium]|nr:D-alanyl-D-alanine carboxypeptidase [Candidatus Sumerlaeia bacterium]